MAVAAVAAFPIAQAARIVGQRPHVVLYGDQALLELGARRAAQLDQLVGPYSRSGFHHPGPAVLYLLAPFVRLFGSGGAGLYLGAVIINGAALIAAVAVTWRRIGPRGALWTAITVDLFCLCVGVDTLREPWNPYLVVAPMVLFIVLWAAGVTGSTSAALWAAVVGSYQIQTHIATVPVVVAMLAVLAVRVGVVRHRRGGTRAAGSGRSRAGSIGAVALALIWVPPTVELWRDTPNNVQLLWDFFTSPHTTAAPHHALRIAADALTIMPFGNRDYALALDRSPIEVAGVALVAVVGSITAVAGGRRRRQPTSVALAASAVIGAALGTLSLIDTDGPVYLYFAVWLAYVPLAVLLALGAALVGAPSPPATPATPSVGHHTHDYRSTMGRSVRAAWFGVALVGVALTVMAATVVSDLRLPSVSATTGSGPWPPGHVGTAQGKARALRTTAALSSAAEGVLGRGDHWVNVTIASNGLWPYVAGMVLDLSEHGVQSTVAPSSWELYFGHQSAPGRSVSVTFTLYPSTDTAAIGRSQETVIADTDGAVLTYRRDALSIGRR